MVKISDFKGKYWHKLSHEEVEKIMSIEKLSVGELIENIKQPDWCNYHQALSFSMGCWSLCTTEKDGLRTKISKEFCKSCDCSA